MTCVEDLPESTLLTRIHHHLCTCGHLCNIKYIILCCCTKIHGGHFRNLEYPLPDLLNTISVTGNVCQWKTAVYGLVWNKLLHTTTRPVLSPVATHSSTGCPAIQVGNLPVLPVLCLYTKETSEMINKWNFVKIYNIHNYSL